MMATVSSLGLLARTAIQVGGMMWSTPPAMRTVCFMMLYALGTWRGIERTPLSTVLFWLGEMSPFLMGHARDIFPGSNSLRDFIHPGIYLFPGFYSPRIYFRSLMRGSGRREPEHIAGGPPAHSLDRS